jgi:hypothetical protein
VETVRVLGYDGFVAFTQTSRGLAIDLPEHKPVPYVQCIKVTLA